MLDYRDLVDMGLSPDLPTLTRRVVALAESMGFGLASGVLIRGRFGSDRALIRSFGNPPEAFIESSKSLDEGMRDPLLAQLLAKPGHVSYDQALYAEAGAADLWDCQAPFGYRCGLSVSIHHPSHGEAFLFGVDGAADLPTNTGRKLQLQAALQMIAMHASEVMQRLVGLDSPSPQVELNAGERRALQTAGAAVYARRGSLVDVSTLGGPHLASAVRKLGARSVPDAVLRAVDAGYLPR